MPPYVTFIIVLCSAAAAFAVMCMAMVLMIYKKMFGYHFEHDPLVTTYTPEGVGVTSSPVEIELDGKMIRGGVYSSQNGETEPDKLVILCHGMWGSHRSYMQEIGFLCSKGLLVLSFDYIGVSASDGSSIRGFGQSLRCLDRVIRYVKSDKELSRRRIWLMGHSWGGYAVSNVVRFHPDVEGVVALAPAASYDAVIRNVFPKSVHFLIPAAKLTDKLRMGRFANQSAVKSLESYDGKALFIHSKDDPMCPYETTTGAVKEKFADRFDYIVMDDKGHHPQYTYEGLAIMREYNAKMKELTSEADKNEHKKNTDFLAIGALDEGVMNTIVDYIKK